MQALGAHRMQGLRVDFITAIISPSLLHNRLLLVSSETKRFSCVQLREFVSEPLALWPGTIFISR